MAPPTTGPSAATHRRGRRPTFYFAGENTRRAAVSTHFTPASPVQARPAGSRMAGSPQESFPATDAGLSLRGRHTADPGGVAGQHIA